jgi:hypothetical protein
VVPLGTQRGQHGAPPVVLREVLQGGAAAQEFILNAWCAIGMTQWIVEGAPGFQRAR